MLYVGTTQNRLQLSFVYVNLFCIIYIYIYRVMLTSAFRVLIKNPVKESFCKKEKEN